MDATQRFSSRVGNYVRFRPGYPRQVIELLLQECGLNAEATVADVASGTGIFTRLLLETGCRVFGVEPNPEMREAGEKFLGGDSRFTSVAGKAEGTTLPAHSMDLVTAAQAAHWFDLPRARQEFVRILKPGGWAALIWNERSVDSTPFLRAYEDLLLAYGTDYKDVRHERTTANMQAFFSPSGYQERVFAVRQELDYEGLRGRLLSSSYVPHEGHNNYHPMLSELRRVFEENQIEGQVTVPYRTLVYYGQLQ
ncbi:MAG TPA: class I SAM-dependent methyltransferase [Terriglobales bacterium]